MFEVSGMDKYSQNNSLLFYFSISKQLLEGLDLLRISSIQDVLSIDAEQAEILKRTGLMSEFLGIYRKAIHISNSYLPEVVSLWNQFTPVELKHLQTRGFEKAYSLNTNTCNSTRQLLESNSFVRYNGDIHFLKILYDIETVFTKEDWDTYLKTPIFLVTQNPEQTQILREYGVAFLRDLYDKNLYEIPYFTGEVLQFFLSFQNDLKSEKINIQRNLALNRPLPNYGLPRRVINALFRANIYTGRDLYSQIRSVRNIGKVGKEELEEKFYKVLSLELSQINLEEIETCDPSLELAMLLSKREKLLSELEVLNSDIAEAQKRVQTYQKSKIKR